MEFEQPPPSLVFNTYIGIRDIEMNLDISSDLGNLELSPLYMLSVLCVSNNDQPYNCEGD